MADKTVYILGAGFSKEAGAPSQEELVKKIFEIATNNPNEFQPKYIDEFQKFLKDTLCIPENLHNKIPLEDIFTPLDRCIIDNISFRELDVKKTIEIRELIYYLIGKTMDFILKGSVTKDYIDKFAKYIIKKSSVRKNYKYSIDSVSVISTNWDILLDNSIESEINSNYHGKAVVDYCCDINSFDTNSQFAVLGRGGFNIKLLKLHGSLNWLQCPRCLRAYVVFHNKIAVTQYDAHNTCRHCDNNFEKQKSHELISNLIMPTYLKNFSNPQYKMIWQNAGIELSEATKIVFIGYSLPQADFEMRQLLSRMIRKDVIIEVVDYGKKSTNKIQKTEERYNVFFGDREPTFHLKGARNYIENNCN